MEKRDYYRVLGLDRGAGGDEIKRAYRRLAMQYHPDRNPDDEEAEHRFKEVSEAYDILKDPQKRAAYDRFGHDAFRNGGPSGGGAGGFGADAFSDIFEDLFGDFMGRGGARRGRSTAQRGADLKYNLEISLEDAFRGTEASISFPVADACETCNGSGARKGSRPEACQTCGGHGKIRLQQGFFMMERTCTSCHGQGQVISDPCGDCGGEGRTRTEKTLVVKVPKGVEDGTRIRLSREGEAGLRGGPPGDLYIFISIRPHPIFQRRGADLVCPLPVPVHTAILGGEIEVPLLNGKRAKVKIDAGTQPGTRYKLKGKGMPHLNTGTYGNMIVEAQVETPTNLSKEQKKLIRKFAEMDKGRTSPKSQGFFDKVRDVFDDLTD